MRNFAFTMVPYLKQRKGCLMNLHSAFTMAEILLSLTIIGVIAAITLPSLTGNINERTWNTQRKALYARVSQAVALMPSLNGYGTLTEGDSSTSAIDTATETFITSGLAKVMKINNICDHEHIKDCGIPSKITDLSGSVINNIYTELNHLTGLNYMFNGTASDSYNTITYSQLDTKAAAFETANGENILAYYNPRCIADRQLEVGRITQGNYMGRDWVQEKVCANFIYDLNGTKGPNTVGKDIGVITIFYPTDSVVVAPNLKSSQDITTHTFSDLNKLCESKFGEGFRAPTKDDLGSIWVNRKLFGIEDNTRAKLSTTRYLASDGEFYRWTLSMNYGFYGLTNLNGENGANWTFCVGRN